MKKFKNKLLILTAIASLFGLCGNIQTHAMTNNSIEEKNDFLGKNNSIEEKNNFLCKKRNKDNTEDSKNDNYFYNKFLLNDNLNTSFDDEKSDEFKLDEFKPGEFKQDEFTEDLKNDIYFYNKFPVNNNLNNNSANNEQNENVSNNKNIISPYNSLKEDLDKIIKEYKKYFQVYKEEERKGELIYNYTTIYRYINKIRNSAFTIIETKYPNITNQIFDKIFNEILIEAIRKEHKDDENYIFNFTIQNDNGSYVGVTQNDKDKIQTIISTLTKAIKTLRQSPISSYKNAIKYLLMADTKIQKSDNKTDYLDKNTAEKFADFLLDKIKNVSNNENIIPPDEYNSLKKDLDEIIKNYKEYFQIFEYGKLKGELNCRDLNLYTYIGKMRDKTLPIIVKKYPNITSKIFDEILIEAIREEHKDDENYIFNFTIQNNNGSYVGVTQNDKDKIQNVIYPLTKAIKTLSKSAISSYKSAIKYLLMANTKIQKFDNKTYYLDKNTAEKFAKQLIKNLKLI